MRTVPERRASPTPKRRALAVCAGLMAVAAYAGGAWLSGTLSPTARRALLDGGNFTAPYRWVSPPPQLADGNELPVPGDFKITFTDTRSDAGVFSTIDQQASIVLSRGTIPRVADAASVHLTTTPLDPASIGPPPSDLSVLGNAYRIAATYDPGGDAVAELDAPTLVILVYPALVTHGVDRTLLFSPDGRTWAKLKTTDDPASFQARATAKGLNGYYEVVANGPVSVSPSAGPGGGAGASAIPWIVIGVAVVVAVALMALRLRARSGSGGTTAPEQPPAPVRPGPAAGSPRGASTRKRSSKKRRR
jgi:hypothetical protein